MKKNFLNQYYSSNLFANFLMVIISITCSIIVNAQSLNITNPYTQTINYLEYITAQDSYWDGQIALLGIESLTEDESSPYVQYQKWRDEWLPRLKSSSGMSGYQANLEYLNDHPITVLPASGDWREIGPIDFPTSQSSPSAQGIGPVNFVSLAPDFLSSHLMFTGGWNCGLFYSEDAGLSWNPVIDHLTAGISASDCKASHLDNDVWFMSDGNGDGLFTNGPSSGPVRSRGVYRTLDRGTTWELVCDAVEDLEASMWEFQIKRILIDPSSSTQNLVIYITTSKGIYRTINGMDAAEDVSWELVVGSSNSDESNLPNGYFISDFSAYDMIFIPQPNPQCNDCGKLVATVSKLYLQNGDSKIGSPCSGGSFAFNGIPDLDVFISEGANAISRGNSNSWESLQLDNQLDEYVRASLAYSSNDPNSFFVFASRCANADDDVRIYRFNLSTQSFTPLNTSGPSSWGGYGSMMSGDAFDVSPSTAARMYIVSNTRMKVTTNGGSTFTSTSSSGYHDDVEDIIFTPDGNAIYAATHGGIFLHNINQNTWEPRCYGLGVAEVSGLSSPVLSEEGLSIGCFHDRSMMSIEPYSENWLPNWKQTITADGKITLTNPDNPSIRYVSSQSTTWDRYKNTDNFATISTIVLPEPAGSAAESNRDRMVLNYFDPNKIYISEKDIYRHENGGSTNLSEWTEISDFSLLLNDPTVLAFDIFTSTANKDVIICSTTGTTYGLVISNKATSSASIAQNSWGIIPVPTDIYGGVIAFGQVAFDPIDPNVFYVVTGISPPDWDAPYKILKYTFNGNILTADLSQENDFTIEDISFNFPAIHSSSIFVNPGTVEFYVGSDLEVYYTNANLIESGLNGQTDDVWFQYGSGLPHARAGFVVPQFGRNQLRAGTTGRGVWEIPMPCEKLSYSFDILTGQTINLNRFHRFRQDVVVNNGGVLNITGKVFFAPDCRIIVMPGGKVVVNGGFMTNACPDQLWSGIEVWGNQCLTQSAANQGTVELLNGAIIEHAQCAIRTGNLASTTPTWQYDWAKTGGIIKAANSTFRNNRKDVEFLSYQNFAGGTCLNPTILLANKSTFTNCNFEVTEKVLGGGSTLDTRVSMYDVHGVRFTSCNWKIYGDALTVYNKHQRGKGIYSIVASYIVGGRCAQSLPLSGECEPNMITGETLDDTNDDIIPSEFENLSYAIRSLGPDGYSKVSISTCIFRNNLRGIYLLACADPYLVRNKFFIPPFSFSDPDEPDALSSLNSYYGMSLNECTGYNMRRNYFTTNTPNNNRTVGVWITSSGPETNEIYLNDFHNLYAGSIAQGINQNEETDLDGLEMLCGLYQNCEYDLALTHSAQIALYQGSSSLNDPSAPAGNIFDNSGVHDEGDYFVSENSEFLVYWHHDPNSNFNVIPEYRTSNKVIPSPTENVILTSRNQGCPKVKRDESDPHLLHEKVLEKRTSIQEIQGILYVLMDNGNTELLLTYVQNPNNTSSEVRQLLLEASPFCSSDILIAAMKRNPAMNQWHLCEVLLANSPLNPATWLEYQKDMPLASFLDALLTQYQTGTNARINTEDLLKKEKQEKDRALSNYIRAQLIHTNNETYLTQEIKDLLATELDYDQNKRIRTEVAILLAEGKYADAEELLASYNEDEQYDVWKEFGEVLLSLKHDGGSSITETEIATLQDLAITGKFGSGRAAALLELLTGVQTEEILILPDETLRSLKIKQEKKMPQLSGVYPNPASGAFYITYVLPTERQSAFIRIFDLKGALVHEENITAGYGITELNSTNFENGQYIFDLVLNNEVVATNKFQIMN